MGEAHTNPKEWPTAQRRTNLKDTTISIDFEADKVAEFLDHQEEMVDDQRMNHIVTVCDVRSHEERTLPMRSEQEEKEDDLKSCDETSLASSQEEPLTGIKVADLFKRKLSYQEDIKTSVSNDELSTGIKVEDLFKRKALYNEAQTAAKSGCVVNKYKSGRSPSRSSATRTPGRPPISTSTSIVSGYFPSEVQSVADEIVSQVQPVANEIAEFATRQVEESEPLGKVVAEGNKLLSQTSDMVDEYYEFSIKPFLDRLVVHYISDTQVEESGEIGSYEHFQSASEAAFDKTNEEMKLDDPKEAYSSVYGCCGTSLHPLMEYLGNGKAPHSRSLDETAVASDDSMNNNLCEEGYHASSSALHKLLNSSPVLQLRSILCDHTQWKKLDEEN